MEVRKSLLNFFFCSLILVSCEAERKDSFTTLVEDLKAHKAQEEEMFRFVVPDSIPALLVAAVYYEHHLGAHGVIVYADTNKKEAYNFTFFKDSTVQCDEIIAVKFNEFKSTKFDVLYIIKKASVAKIVQSGSLGFSSENIRIDNGNTYESLAH